jgi:hypothetical protein
MPKLSDLGFKKGIIAETILSTSNAEGKPNAAPMGVIMQDEQHLTVNIFNSSSTCANIKVNRCAVLNLTSNTEVFYKTAFKEANADGKLPLEWFEPAETVHAPKLRFADAAIEVSVDDLAPFGLERTQASFSVQCVQASRKYPQVQCRAASLTLEAIIHATRVKAFMNNDGKQAQVNKILEKINDYSEEVNRIAPNSTYSSVMNDLVKRIDSWRKRK